MQKQYSENVPFGGFIDILSLLTHARIATATKKIISSYAKKFVCFPLLSRRHSWWPMTEPRSGNLDISRESVISFRCGLDAGAYTVIATLTRVGQQQ